MFGSCVVVKCWKTQMYCQVMMFASVSFFITLVGVSVFSIMWLELLMMLEINVPL